MSKVMLLKVKVNTVKIYHLKREYVTIMDFVILCIFGNMYLVNYIYNSD